MATADGEGRFGLRLMPQQDTGSAKHSQLLEKSAAWAVRTCRKAEMGRGEDITSDLPAEILLQGGLLLPHY